MNKAKRKKIITKTFNELYNAFYYLYQYKKDDILYNGYDGTDETSIDCFGHYFEYNGRRYAVDVGYPGEFGYVPDNPINCYSVCAYRFISGKEFAHKNADAYIEFSFNMKTEILSEILEVERNEHDWKLEAEWEECEKYISKEQIKIDENGKFKYITEGFCLEKDDSYLDEFCIDNDFYNEFFGKF